MKKKKDLVVLLFGLVATFTLLAVSNCVAQEKSPISETKPTPPTATNAPSLSNDPASPLLAARTEQDIHFGLMATNKHGKLEFLHPLKRRFQHQNRDYLVAIDNNLFGDGGEPYAHAWLYVFNKSCKEWRCFQITHFRNVHQLDAELDSRKGQIVIKCVSNQKLKGAVLTTFNHDATNDDASYVH